MLVSTVFSSSLPWSVSPLQPTTLNCSKFSAKKAKILKCVNKSKSECKGRCSWGYHNGAQTAYCAPKGNAGSTPCDGLAFQPCSQTSGCRWDGKACIPLHVTESCGGLTVHECYNKGNICKWDGKACVRK